jgi:hypothetical protein
LIPAAGIKALTECLVAEKISQFSKISFMGNFHARTGRNA